MNQPNAQENNAGDESDHSTTVPTSSMSIDDPPVNDNNLAVNDEPDAVPSGSSGSLRMNYDTGECAICMGPHEDKSRLNCGHFFCFQCLVEWCRVKLQCPTCRQPFADFVHQSAGSAQQEEVYTPDPLPVPITNDPGTMIPILMSNGAWLWFDRDWLPLLNMSAEEFQRFLNPVAQPRINDQPNPNDPSEDLD
uniref:RING-type E3 ubiquitin transferase n=1 Tax=Daphnia galeata TaxID=27404 RepID=A0A8J2WC93_9CRUS|nr:unnamed protein product [Daphnia galeata]